MFKDSIQGSTGDVEAWLPKLFLLLTDSSPLFSPAFPFPPLLPPSLSKPESDPGFPVVRCTEVAVPSNISSARLPTPLPFDRTTLVRYPATPQSQGLVFDGGQ